MVQWLYSGWFSLPSCAKAFNLPYNQLCQILNFIRVSGLHFFGIGVFSANVKRFSVPRMRGFANRLES